MARSPGRDNRMTQVQTLTGKEIVIGVTGSIAAVDVVKLIHVLRRKGARVQVVMSRAATGIIHPDALTYASGRPVITRLSGMVEHVGFCGDSGTADLLLIAPCTANTLGKIACGIDDTPVTTFATTSLGSGIPFLVVPAMHQSMYRHPAVMENLKRMREWGIVIIDPRIDEGKAKIAPAEEIVLWAERMVLGHPLKERRVLITSGPCREPIDDVRLLTTRSSGQMGRQLALHAFRLGADVTVVHRDIFPCVHNIFAETGQEMYKKVTGCFSKIGADIYISAAAISDYAPMKVKGKIPSGKSCSIDLNPMPKILDEVISKFRPVTVAFKLGWDSEMKARDLLMRGVVMVVCNTPETMGSDRGAFVLQTKDKNETIEGSKEEAAIAIWNCLLALQNEKP
jgi:phosphopantothenoylcysteine decarboxylase/phosphopantothenate--cysteine ligase